MIRSITDTDREAFADYFGVADELSVNDEPGNDFTMTLDDLDKRFVKRARKAADALGLSWPPRLAEAEEFALDLADLDRRERLAAERDARWGDDHDTRAERAGVR